MKWSLQTRWLNAQQGLETNTPILTGSDTAYRQESVRRGDFIPASMYGPGIISGLLQDYDEASATLSFMNVVHKVRQEKWCKREEKPGPDINWLSQACRCLYKMKVSYQISFKSKESLNDKSLNSCMTRLVSCGSKRTLVLGQKVSPAEM